MSVLHVMSPEEGDKRIQYEEDNQKDVAKAKKTFKEKLKDGYRAYGYKKGDRIGKLIRKFSPDFDRILMTPPFVGG